MKKSSKFETAQIRTGSVFDPLPKNAYVMKVIGVKEEPNKSGSGSHIKIAFDIAEGEYKDFYKKQFDANASEDKKWPYDGIYNLAAPDDDSPQWMWDSFKTFVSALEDSNNGYHWDWDESKWKDLIIGGLFRNEQSESGGNIYDHTRPYWFRSADTVRSGKYGRLPKDKLIEGTTAKKDGWVSVPGGEVEVPF